METTTQLSAEDQALRDAADAARADLNHDVQAASKGDEKVPLRIEPSAARKGIYKKSGEMHEAELARVMAENPNVAAHVAQLQAEAGTPVAAPAAAPAAPAPAGPPAAAPSQDTHEYVTVAYKGRSLSVARSDIDRAGGENAYLRQREMDDREAALAAEARAMEIRKREIEAAEQRRTVQAEVRQTPAGHGAPAGPSTPAASPDANQAHADRAKALAAMIYSGDPEEAAKAIEQILSSQQPGTSIDPEQVARLAVDRLRQEQAAAAATRGPVQTPASDPVWERTRQRINRMAEQDFPVIARDPALTQRTRNEIIRLSNLPANATRRAEDIAFEACQAIMGQVEKEQGKQQQARTELKRGLPPSPQAGGSAPVAGDAQVPSNSQYVEMMRARRQF